jgi:tRNA-Thr(GGU) m(6)t(6)A37 methyltransferase TsaA
MNIEVIARIKSDFPNKFGIPRQSGLINTKAKIVFENKFRDKSALRDLENFSHLWLIWEFSANPKSEWSPTVRPPRLGGNKRVGVFATRSPFRPNPLGLSSVKLERIYEDGENGTVIEISGADLMNGTPIYDIKPYIPYTDCHTDALGGFSDDVFNQNLKVSIPQNIKEKLPQSDLENIFEILKSDPRPHYHSDCERVYAFEFAKYHIEFRVDENILTVIAIEDIDF